MSKTEFVDAWKMAKKSPKTFQIPNTEEVNSIKEGTYVKVCAESERFWVRVESINEDGTCKGRIEQSDMFCTEVHGYEHDDEVVVSPKHIYSIYNK